ncbi:hypothetical protein GP486_005988 [Trichoglossum hirsutum]|uniref:Uncharacterized protein n=1 Tax=Trichoglossum hirsutum TaxID=265104 RepID=A0A9P8L893_9PEZI|nr:hypothetical protein GP486_005988 [Trichoglossum hirsutum]
MMRNQRQQEEQSRKRRRAEGGREMAIAEVEGALVEKQHGPGQKHALGVQLGDGVSQHLLRIDEGDDNTGISINDSGS